MLRVDDWDVLGDGLEKILTWAFKGCVSLERIKVPPDVKAIREGAFHGCSGLTTAILSSGLEVIEMHRDTTRNNCNQGLQILLFYHQVASIGPATRQSIDNHT